MWKIYGTLQCPSCNNAKNLLKHQDIPFMFEDVSKDPSKMPAGHRTVPVVYDSKGTLIGGYNDLLVHLQNGATNDG